MGATKEVVLDIHPQPRQREFMESNARYTLYGGARGGGKLVSDDSVVLTPFGFKSGSELGVGDLINNPDGTVQRIIQIKPRVTLEKWTVVFSDGTRLSVAKDHLWLAWKANKTRKVGNRRLSGEASAEVVETQTFMKWLNRGYTPQIPVCAPQPFNMTSRWELLDPYLMGALLGDGCFTGRNVTLTCDEKDKPHYIKQFNGLDFTTGTHNNIVFVGDTQKRIMRLAERWGLADKKSHDKFIPRYYKLSSVENRMALIQGLMDTDGYNAPDKGACYYYSVSRKLAEDVAFVLRSLGALVTITEKQRSYKDQDDEKIEYCLYIRYKQADDLFRIKRKHCKKNCQTVNKRVVDIEVGGTVTGRCITVSNPNGLYVTDDFIVTHNSWSARTKLELMCLRYPGIQCCLTRRIRQDLLKNHLTDMLKDLEYSGLARWKDTQNAFVFTSAVNSKGVPSRIYFEFLDSERDLYKFQGPAYDVISVEEATQFTPAMLDAMKTANRPSFHVEDPDFKPRMYLTANPGGSGHAEIKRLFIDRHFRQGIEKPENYKFIPATVYDNKILMELDPGYVQSLETLPPAKKKAMLYGDWNAYEGQFFEQFTDNPEGYDSRVMTHVINPFEIPASWPRYMGYDYGSKRPFSIHWYAVSGDGRLYCYKEYYGGDPNFHNTGISMPIKEQADVIKRMEEPERVQGIYITRMADPAIFAKDTTKMHEGESIADMFEKESVFMNPASNHRISGWSQIAQRMMFDEEGRPMLYIFKNCKNLIRTIPLMMGDINRPEDIDTSLEDHAVDELRYVCNTVQLNVDSRIKNKAAYDYDQARKMAKQKQELPPIWAKPRGSYYG